MKNTTLAGLAAVAALTLGGAAVAQGAAQHQHGQHAQGQMKQGQMKQGQGQMKHGEHGMMMKGDMSMHGGPAGHDNMMAMHNMHQAMMKATDRDPDRAFAKMMIEHHRGGIAMSEVLMKHGDDAELKRMAQKTMEMQRKEIGELQGWLDRHGGR